MLARNESIPHTAATAATTTFRDGCILDWRFAYKEHPVAAGQQSVVTINMKQSDGRRRVTGAT